MHSRRVPIFTRGLAPLVVVHLAGWPGARVAASDTDSTPYQRRAGGRKSERAEWSRYRSTATERRTDRRTDRRTVGRGVLPVPLGRAHREEGPTNRLAGPAHICCATVTPRRTAAAPLSFNAVYECFVAGGRPRRTASAGDAIKRGQTDGRADGRTAWRLTCAAVDSHTGIALGAAVTYVSCEKPSQSRQWHSSIVGVTPRSQHETIL